MKLNRTVGRIVVSSFGWFNGGGGGGGGGGTKMKQERKEAERKVQMKRHRQSYERKHKLEDRIDPSIET